MVSNEDMDFLLVVVLIAINVVYALYELRCMYLKNAKNAKFDRIEALRERAKSIYIDLRIPHVSGYGKEQQEILLKLEKEIETLEGAIRKM